MESLPVRSQTRSKFMTQSIAPIRVNLLSLTIISPPKTTGKISKKFQMNFENIGYEELSEIDEGTNQKRPTFYDLDIEIPEDSPIHYKPDGIKQR